MGSDSTSENTGNTSGTAAAPSSGSSSSQPEHWALRLLSRIGAYALATPVAYKLSDWLPNESISWTTKGIAALFVITVAFPSALKDLATVIDKARGAGK